MITVVVAEKAGAVVAEPLQRPVERRQLVDVDEHLKYPIRQPMLFRPKPRVGDEAFVDR
jgi:hypothetical protein